MHREGHHGFNALLYAPIALVTAFVVSVELAIVGAVLFVGLSSVPDFDRHFDKNMNSNRSDLWTLVPIKHRGFTHTVWFAGIAGAFGVVLSVVMAPQHPVEVTAPFGFLMAFGGIIGHIIGDAFTPMGVRPFRPVKQTRYSLAWFKAKNPIANYGFLLIGFIALLSALGYAFTHVGIDLATYGAMITPAIW